MSLEHPRRTIAAIVIAAVAFIATAAMLSGSATARTDASNPATWRPWYLSSASQFRLGPPPAASSAKTKAELAELRRLQAHRTAAVKKTILKWNGQAAVLPWSDLLFRMIENYRPRPPFAARDVGLFYTGLEDAVIAAADSRTAFAKTRPAPWKLDPRLKPAVKPSSTATYAPSQAAIAGAAEKILPYLFPNEPARTFTRTASEAVQSLLQAGLAYRSDIQAGRTLGQKVAGVTIERGNTDNSGAAGFSNGPLAGETYWISTPPLYEAPTGGPVGKWKPVLMSSAGQLRSVIPGPSKYGSPEFLAQVKLVLTTSQTLTDEQKQIADFWDDRPGTVTPAGHWISIGAQLIKSYKTPGDRAARILAYLAATEQDAAIGFFEAKYMWWAPRPITAIWRADADVTKLYTEAECKATPALCPYREKWLSYIATPPFPSYPAGHPTFSGGAAKVLGWFFPKAAADMTRLAEQAGTSRLYGGIHYDEDNKAGLILGRAIADIALKRAQADGIR